MGYYQAGDYYAAGDPGFFDWVGGALKSVGGAVVSGLRAVAPIAAPILGTAFGGPLGGMIGGAVGSLLGGGGGGGNAPAYGVPQPHAAAYNDMISFAQPPTTSYAGYGRPAYNAGMATMTPAWAAAPAADEYDDSGYDEEDY